MSPIYQEKLSRARSGREIYEPGIHAIVKALFRKELEEHRKRVQKTERNYSYEPSIRYKRFISHHLILKLS